MSTIDQTNCTNTDKQSIYSKKKLKTSKTSQYADTVNIVNNNNSSPHIQCCNSHLEYIKVQTKLQLELPIQQSLHSDNVSQYCRTVNKYVSSCYRPTGYQ